MSTRRLPYRSPHRDYALAIQRRSIVEAATTVGKTQDEFVEGLADHYRGQLRRALYEARETGPMPEPTPIDYRSAYQHLCADSWYVLEYRQDLVDLGFDAALHRLERWLAASPAAQAMVNRSTLRRFAGARAAKPSAPIWRAFADAVRSIQILAPLTGGMDASALDGTIPAIEIGAGIFDAFSGASKLVVASSVLVEPGNRLMIRDLRQDPRAFAKATNELREILKVTAGKKAMARTYTLQGAYAHVADELRKGAEAFVTFHELAHLLLPRRVDPHEEEDRCDEFAAHLLCASQSEFIVLGLSMALMLLAAVLREAGNFIVCDTHPRFGRRMDKMWELIEQYGVTPSHEGDILLAVPSRIMEEVVFRTETRQRIAPNLAISLRDGWKSSLVRDHNWIVAQAMIRKAVRIPTLKEDTRRTWWDYEGYRFMLLVVELRKAITAARQVLEAKAPCAPWSHEQVACDAALRLLAFLGNESPPSAEAIALFASVAGVAGPRKGPTKSASSSAWTYLEKVGAVHRETCGASIRPLVGLEFYVPSQSY
jgi:hypothetical protein